MIGNLVLLLLGILVRILLVSVMVLEVMLESLGPTTISASSADIFYGDVKRFFIAMNILKMNVKVQP